MASETATFNVLPSEIKCPWCEGSGVLEGDSVLMTTKGEVVGILIPSGPCVFCDGNGKVPIDWDGIRFFAGKVVNRKIAIKK